MLRNNLITVLIHAVNMLLSAAGVYSILSNKGALSEGMTAAYIGLLSLSFISGFILRRQTGIARQLMSTIALFVVPVLLLPVYWVNETVLQAIYFYGLYHLPMAVVERLFMGMPISSVFFITITPYIACTAGYLLKCAFTWRKRTPAISVRPLWIAALILPVLLTSCSSQTQHDLAQYMKSGSTATEAASDYSLSVLFLHGDNQIQSQAALQQLQQSLYANTIVRPMPIRAFEREEAGTYDLIYLDVGLDKNPRWEEVRPMLMDYVGAGGRLYLQHHYARLFPAEFLGIRGVVPVEDSGMEFTYPDHGLDVQGLQQAWRSFVDVYHSYGALNPKHHIVYEFAVEPDGATPIVERDGLAYMTIHQWGTGRVLWSNQLLLSELFGTRLDLVLEEGQKYTHNGWLAASLWFRSEVVNYVSKDKYGFSIKRAYGAYGRPSLAWQAHYEALYSYVLRDMMKFTELLKTYDQVPTYSIVRGTYNGGQWNEAIRIHPNEGDHEQPVFEGVHEDSFFSAGQIATAGKQYLFFNTYKGYHSFLSPIPDPYRAYPARVAEGLDEELDLVIGAADGSVTGLKITSTADKPYEVQHQPLKVEGGGAFAARYAAPAVIDWNGDGRFDLLVGGDRSIALFLQNRSGKFAEAGVLKIEGEPLAVNGAAAPHIADWNGDGAADLIVGDAGGIVSLYPGAISSSGELSFGSGVRLLEAAPYAAPFVHDWNRDGRLDLLVGSYEGEITVYLQDEAGQLKDSGVLTGQNHNFFGSKSIIPGHYAVPLVMDWNRDGVDDLVTGHLEYGNTYSVDSEYFPYQQALRESLAYVRKQHLPLIPHMYLHEYMSDEQELREMQLHQQAFNRLGLAWDGDMGVNHHTWRINNNPHQTFRNQREVGIWWNFGFNPPGVPSAPRDGKEFLLVTPFMLAGNDPEREPYEEFMLSTPAPHPLNYPIAWEALAGYDIPLTMFEHVEHGLKPFTSVYDKLIREIEYMDRFREEHNYSFMTEDQMARSLLNTFYGKLKVQIEADKLLVQADLSDVPPRVKEYVNTLGVKVELGEKYRQHSLSSSSLFHYEDEKGFYIGLYDKVTELRMTEQSAEDSYIRIEAANSPVVVRQEEGRLKLQLDAKGMQEIKLYSPVELIIEGKGIKVTSSGNRYRIIHYGERMEAEIRLN